MRTLHEFVGECDRPWLVDLTQVEVCSPAGRDTGFTFIRTRSGMGIYLKAEYATVAELLREAALREHEPTQEIPRAPE